MKKHLLILSGIAAFLFAHSAQAKDTTGCVLSKDIRLFVSPARPHTQQPVQIMVVHSGTAQNGEIWIQRPDGTQEKIPTVRLGGPPHGYVGTIENPVKGRWRAGLVVNGEMQTCKRFRVRKYRIRTRSKRVVDESTVWHTYRRWTPALENLYSIWIEHLFDAPLNQEPTWNALHELTQDPTRNVLYDHLGLGEDTPDKGAEPLKPDCADFPYFLRGYFAWKWSLPFAYRACWQGRRQPFARCQEMKSNADFAEAIEPDEAFYLMLKKKVARSVSSSSARTEYKSEDTDLYPVSITRHSIRPGTVFSDPYGHLLVVSKLIDSQNGEPGILFAVDAQPDATIGRRRFWRGSFLFPPGAGNMGAGFKRFRPIIRVRGETQPMKNWRIKRYPGYKDFDFQQQRYTPDEFYDAVAGLTNVSPLTPQKALEATVVALAEQIRRRVVSVNTGEKWKQSNPDQLIEMPKSTQLFQTSGPWEDFSTPSRDMRLLIAIDTVFKFPDTVLRRPEHYGLSDPAKIQSTHKELMEKLKELASSHTFTYRKSDGSKHQLSVWDVIQRREALEMAYNPNDCPETRWGAPVQSEEHATCTQQAPDRHIKQMRAYRPWFHRRVRPTHQDPFPETNDP